MNFKNYTEIKDAEYVHFGVVTGLVESIWKRVTPDGQEEPMFQLIYVNRTKRGGWVRSYGGNTSSTFTVQQMSRERDPLDLWTRKQYEEFMFTELI